MPELPEVEVVRLSLQKIFEKHPVIEKIRCYRPDLRFPLPMKYFKSLLGARIERVSRRAKYLLVETDRGRFVCHLGMTGQFRLLSRGEALQTHDHVEFVLSSEIRLVFSDPRRFGFMLKWPGHWDKVTREKLGVEPLLPDWNADYFFKLTRGKAAPCKNILMDQKVVVGIGNIYASEIMFRSKLLPTRPGSRLRLGDCALIVENSRIILQEAIRNGGSSIRDFQSPEGGGSYQDAHRVYGREKEPCPVCGSKIRRKVLAGRSTFWCPSCQK